ncbi:unnamed protein product, partial [Mesorhabditis spiculigera]
MYDGGIYPYSCWRQTYNHPCGQSAQRFRNGYKSVTKRFASQIAEMMEPKKRKVTVARKLKKKENRKRRKAAKKALDGADEIPEVDRSDEEMEDGETVVTPNLLDCPNEVLVVVLNNIMANKGAFEAVYPSGFLENSRKLVRKRHLRFEEYRQISKIGQANRRLARLCSFYLKELQIPVAGQITGDWEHGAFPLNDYQCYVYDSPFTKKHTQRLTTNNFVRFFEGGLLTPTLLVDHLAVKRLILNDDVMEGILAIDLSKLKNLEFFDIYSVELADAQASFYRLFQKTESLVALKFWSSHEELEAQIFTEEFRKRVVDELNCPIVNFSPSHEQVAAKRKELKRWKPRREEEYENTIKVEFPKLRRKLTMRKRWMRLRWLL